MRKQRLEKALDLIQRLPTLAGESVSAKRSAPSPLRNSCST